MKHETSLGKTSGSTFPNPLRVLMVYWDGGGNLPPQRALARELIRRGHAVHVLSHDTQASSVAADCGTFHPLMTARQWDPARENTADEEIAFIRGDLAGSARFAEDFRMTHTAIKPDICLIDIMLISTQKAAIELGIKFAVFNHLAWITEGRCSVFFDLLQHAPLVLAASYPAFGTLTSTPPNVHFVGPIREPVVSAPWPRRFPDRPFLLVSLSSTYQGQGATLRNICTALSQLPLEVLITTGRGYAPETLPVGEALEARSFVPHDAVLPSVDLVITHAGLGTLMYSAGAGVPCLCFPNGRDQDDNAARIEALGLGHALSPDATPAEIGSAVMEMLRSRASRTACHAFASQVKRFGDLRRAADLVEELVRVA